MIDEAIDLITRSEYTPERSLAADALLLLKDTIEAKRMDRVLEHQSDRALPSYPLGGDASRLSGWYSGTLSHKTKLKEKG
jgi:hypothetical protein